MMEASSQRKGGRGLWKKGRVTQFSKETQDMLQLMMQQSKLTHLQRKKINESLKRDLEKEKRRLQNILATGEEEPKPASYRNVPACPNPEVAEQKDRYQEVLDEIEERRQFLADMSSLGEAKQYVNIINTEISQRIRELRVLDKACSPESAEITSEQNKKTTEKM
uniref:UPF0193 protein EVG1 isoform X3 n=1 Tax=Gasterosteus aculeatus aculeatus TaxID=481459 RepID=UPI001A98D069|nr:UPF0193 protein EVG1 isoform X3 [Gasterosteus aculeatus aculeatus]